MFETVTQILGRETATPPLLTFPARPINGSRLELKTDEFLERHDAQPKINDHRAMIHRSSGSFFNRHGDRLTTAPLFQEAFEKLDAQLPREPAFQWLDGLCMGRRTRLAAWSIYLIDLPAHEGTFIERNDAIRDHVEIHKYDVPPQSKWAYCLMTWADAKLATMRALMGELKHANSVFGEEFYEGIVCRRTGAKYPVQLRDPDKASPDLIKFRWRH